MDGIRQPIGSFKKIMFYSELRIHVDYFSSIFSGVFVEYFCSISKVNVMFQNTVFSIGLKSIQLID